MRRIGSLLTLAAIAALLPAPAAAAAPLAPGRYCLKEAVEGYTGRPGESIKLGDMTMEVVIKRTRAGHSVWFSNKMADSSQLLEGDTDKARVAADGSLVFEFKDGWSNRGRARIRPDGRVTLTLLRSAGGNQIGRNYGDYRVTRKACAAR